MAWHLEVLGRRQQRVLARIGPLLSERGFYLAGGTAVALRLGHRHSVDFDWFITDGLASPLGLAEELRGLDVPFETDEVAPGTLHGRVSGVNVSFLRYRYPMLTEPDTWRQTRIAGRADLAAMKLSAIAQRGAKKDFVDIYGLGKRSSLRQMLQWYQHKHGVQDMTHMLCSLAYFDDAERERMPTMFWQVTWPTIKDTIRKKLQKLSD
ncbi:MAG TPA: nucleotidyl transferase AbiEii/AbiGii toxin family protein [Gemmataceae bacterium]|nr:nucleotidyl transferase AbiEii/AbiGii toxin family protein [Gemmataceae bacterium]